MPDNKVMKILILIIGLSSYIVLNILVLLTDWGVFWRLLALFMFPLILYGILISRNLDRLLKDPLKKRGLGMPKRDDEVSLDMAYRLLDLPKNASIDQVNQQYRKLIHIVHPDAGGVTHLAKLLNEAKNIIISHPSDFK